MKFIIQTGVISVLDEFDRTAGLFRNCGRASQCKSRRSCKTYRMLNLTASTVPWRLFLIPGIYICNFSAFIYTLVVLGARWAVKLNCVYEYELNLWWPLAFIRCRGLRCCVTNCSRFHGLPRGIFTFKSHRMKDGHLGHIQHSC